MPMAMVLNRKRTTPVPRTTSSQKSSPRQVFEEVRDLHGVAAAVTDFTLEDAVGDEYGDNMCEGDWKKGGGDSGKNDVGDGGDCGDNGVGRGDDGLGGSVDKALKCVDGAGSGVGSLEKRRVGEGISRAEGLSSSVAVAGNGADMLNGQNSRVCETNGVASEANANAPAFGKNNTLVDDEEAELERRREFGRSRLTKSRFERVQEWMEQAARSTEELNVSPSKKLVSSSIPDKSADKFALKASQWPGKEEREKLWSDSFKSRGMRREWEGEGDLASNGTSTRALATATHKPSFDTEVSPRSAPPSPAPPVGSTWSTSHIPRLPLEAVDGQERGDTEKVVKSGSLKVYERTVEDRVGGLEKAESFESESKRIMTRIDSESVMNRELSATLERFQSFGGGLHTSFTARSGALHPNAKSFKKRSRPADDERGEMISSKSFGSTSWKEFEEFMKRGCVTMSPRRTASIDRLLRVLKDISVAAEVFSPPRIPVEVVVLTDEAEKNAKPNSPVVNDLFNRILVLLTDHQNTVNQMWQRKRKRLVMKAEKPPLPPRIPSVKSGRSFVRKYSSETTEEHKNSGNDDDDEGDAVVNNEMEVEETQLYENGQPTLAEGRVESSKRFKRICSRDSISTSVFRDYEFQESQLYPLDLAHQVSNPMRVTFISVESYGNSEASSRLLNFVPHHHRSKYSKYRRSSLSSLSSSHAMSLNSSFTRSDFVPQPPYDGPRPSLVEQSAGEYYSCDPIYYRWKISRVIGRGSFSQVRFARSLRESFRGKIRGGLVAVKLVQKTATDLFTADGICREVASYAKLSKNYTMPNLLDVSEDANTVYLVIEHLEGGHLFNRIAYREFYPNYNERDVAYFIRQLVMGLRDCHKENIIHRDVKPENILFTKDFDKKNPKASSKIVLTDYGISHIGSQGAKEVLGTPLYMAPEVLLRQEYDTSADMWSLGVIAHMMLVGCAPFDEDNLEELMRRIKFDKVNLCGDVWEIISPGAHSFVSMLLVKDPKRRMSAEEALRHPWLSSEISKKGWPRLEVAQVSLQSINARNNLNERNRMEHILSDLHEEQEVVEENAGLYGKNVDFDEIEFDTSSGLVTRKLTSYANGKVGGHAITQVPRRQKMRRLIGRMGAVPPQQQQAVPQRPFSQQPLYEKPTKVALKRSELTTKEGLEDDVSASTIEVPQQDMSANLASQVCVNYLKESLVKRRDADAGDDCVARRGRKRRNRVSRSGRKKLSDEKLKKKKVGSALSASGLYSRLHARLPSQG